METREMIQTQTQVRETPTEATPAETRNRSAEQTQPIPGRPIQWAAADPVESELEVMKSRNWISEELITTSQRHWNCTRQQAIARLITSLDEDSE